VNSAKLNDWLQVIGLFGVIASLMFVGLQMQQDREVAILAAYQARTDLTVESIVSWMDNENFRTANLNARMPEAGPASLTPEERQLVMMQAAAQMYMTENVFFQYESGYLPEDHWQKSRAVLKGSLRRWPLRLVYEEDPEDWRPSFGVLIDEILAEIDAEEADQ
jgi:hypothetical protein